MSSRAVRDRWDGDRVPFDCRWRSEAAGAASVQVSGELDIATSPRLDAMLQKAREHARLVVLDMREVSFMDCSAVHVIVDASEAARKTGTRLLLVGTSQRIDALFEITKTAVRVEILRLAPGDESGPDNRAEVPGGHPSHDRHDGAPSELWSRIRPLDNPANARVISGRVMAIRDRGLWVHAADSAVRRAWAPLTEGLPVPAGTSVEVYLDPRNGINGWWDPRSGLAVNQRHLGPGGSRATGASAKCQGACGLVWQVPAPARFAGRGECCLTCAGPLAFQ